MAHKDEAQPSECGASAPQISPLNEAETAWIDMLVSQADQAGLMASPAALQDFLVAERTAWSSVAPEEREDPNPTVSMIGAALGQMLVNQCDLSWALVTDEYGTDAAVIGDPGSITLFPINAVAKRWTGQSEGDLADYVEGTHRAIERLRRAEATTA